MHTRLSWFLAHKTVSRHDIIDTTLSINILVGLFVDFLPWSSHALRVLASSPVIGMDDIVGYVLVNVIAEVTFILILCSFSIAHISLA